MKTGDPGSTILGMAIRYPEAPPAVGEVAEIEVRPGVRLRLRGVAVGLWRTNMHGQIQAEIRRTADGGFEVLTSNGVDGVVYRAGTWREAMVRGFV